MLKSIRKPEGNDHHPFEDWIMKASNGDNRAFRMIYDAISGKMYSLCLRFAGNSSDANDWFQEGVIKLYRNLDGYRGEGSFEGWTRRVFVATCIDGLKKRVHLFSTLDDELDVATDDLDGYDKLTNKELIDMICQLPDAYRAVVNLYLVEGYTHKDIGDMLHISEEASRSRLFRARILLRKLFKDDK